TPEEGPISLRLSVRPHRQEDGSHSQSITHVLVGNSRGPALRTASGKVTFAAAGGNVERHFRAFVESRSAERLNSLERRSWRKNAEERIWGGPGECEAWFHNHESFVMKGLE